MIPVGKKNRLIRLERWVARSQADGSGEVVAEWVLVESLWAFVARVGEKADSESIEADQPAAIQERFFTVGYVKDLGPNEDTRIVFRGQAFDILAVSPEEDSENQSDIRIHARARAEVAA